MLTYVRRHPIATACVVVAARSYQTHHARQKGCRRVPIFRWSLL